MAPPGGGGCSHAVSPLYCSSMQAVAIFGPRGRERELRRFRDAGAEIAIAEGIGDARVALLFGGDGTVHRHLADAVAAQTKVLVVPAGSGNDFAAALELKTPRDALRSWKQFLRAQSNVRTIDLGRIEPLT